MSDAQEPLAATARDVERAARALERGRRALGALASSGPGALEVEAPACPLEPFRAVSGRRAYDALVLAAPGHGASALPASLARWVAHLTLARVGWDLEVDEAKALRPPPAAPEPPAELPGPALLTLLDSPDALAAFTARAARVTERVLAPREARRERLDEAARRLGLPGRFGRAVLQREVVPGVSSPPPAPAAAPSSLVVAASADLIAVLAAELTPAPRAAPDSALPGVGEAELRAAAERVLQATEGLARAVVGRAHKARTGRPGLASLDALRATLGRESAGVDWPARLTPEWLHARFTALGGAARPAARAPRPLGAASFLLAAARYGEALHREECLRYAPFPLAHDPQFVDAHRTGALLALCVASPPFLARELGAGRGAAADASKVLAACLLFGLRARATAMLVALDGPRSPVARSADDAVGGPRAAVAHLSPRAADDEPARFVAALTAREHHEALVATFDDDYYRNPRAARALRARFALPALATTFVDAPLDGAALAARASTVAAALERELG